MADPIGNVSILQSIPHYHGSVGNPKDSAERFLQSVRRTLAALTPEPTDRRKIALLTRHLQGRAFDWYENSCHPPRHMRCAYDRDRIDTDFDYFCEQFKQKFFVARDQTSISDDISDVRPKEKEPASIYMDRLIFTLRPVTVLLHDRWVARVNAQPNYDQDVPANARTLWQEIAAIPGLPAAITQERFFQVLGTMAQNASRRMAGMFAEDNEFLNVARVAAKHATQEYARDVIREHMLDDGMTLHDLQHRVTLRERIKRAPAMSAQAFVASTTVEGANDDDGNVCEIQTDQTDEAQDADVDAEEEAMLEAVRAQFRKKKKQTSNKRKGANKQQQQPPRGQKITAGQPGGPPSGEPQWCWYCKVATHKTSVCRKMNGAREHYDANPPPPRSKQNRKPWQQKQQQQQQGNPRDFQEFNRQHRGYDREAPERMDVGNAAATNAEYYNQHPLQLDASDPIFGSLSGNA